MCITFNLQFHGNQLTIDADYGKLIMDMSLNTRFRKYGALVKENLYEQIDSVAKSLHFDKLYLKPYSQKFNLKNFGTFEVALTQSEVGFFEWALGGDTVYVSDLVYSYTGITKEFKGSFLDMLKNTIIPESLLDFFTHLKRRLLILGETSSYELEIYSRLHKDFRWFVLKSDVSYDAELDAYTVLGTINDITIQKRAQEDLIESQDILKNVFNTIPLPIIYVDKQENVKFMNATSRQFFSEIVGDMAYDKFQNLVTGDYDSLYEALFSALRVEREKILLEEDNRSRKRYDVTYQNNHKNIIIDNLEMYNHHNKYLGKVIAFTDITEQIDSKVQLTKLLKANELSIEIKDMVDKVDDITDVYKLIFKRIHEIIPNAVTGCLLEIDANNHLKIAVSQGFNETFSNDFSIPFEESFAYENLKGNYSRSVIVEDVRVQYSHIYEEVDNPNRGFDINSNITAPISVNNKLYGILSIDSDKVEAFDELDLNLIDYLRTQIERTINRHNKYISAMNDSRIDPLTKAYNRRFLLKAYESFVQRANWQEDEFALVVFDLDGLKSINDTYGHLIGDKAITQFSALVLSKIRTTDIFARYGGDEFVCLFFKGMNDSILEKIHTWQEELDQNPILIDEEKIQTRFSFGFASYPNDGRDFKTLMDTADTRMYESKKRKKAARQ